jgi:hypothetical protein
MNEQHMTTLLEAAAEDAALTERRLPSSVRRYHVPPTPAQTRTVMRVTEHKGPPPAILRASRTTTTATRATPGRTTPAAKRPSVHRQQQQQPSVPRVNWKLSVGTGMLLMALLWILATAAISLAHTLHDQWTYGYPRTFQIDQDVRHGGVSHFTVENLHGHILIIETPVNHLANAKVYAGPVFSCSTCDTLVATVSFQDLTGNGLPDMIIAVNNQRFVLLNTGSAFRDPTPADRILDQEVQ